VDAIENPGGWISGKTSRCHIQDAQGGPDALISEIRDHLKDKILPEDMYPLST